MKAVELGDDIAVYVRDVIGLLVALMSESSPISKQRLRHTSSLIP